MARYRLDIWPIFYPFSWTGVMMFLICTFVGWVNGCNVDGEIAKVSAEQRQLQIIEQRVEPTPDELGFVKCTNSVRRVLRENREWTLDAPFKMVAGVSSNVETLKQLAPSTDWDLYHPLTYTGCAKTIGELATKYPVLDAFRGTALPSTAIVIPTNDAFYGRTNVGTCYGIFCILFLVWAYSDRSPKEAHFIRHAPWGKPLFMLMVVATAPVTVPIVVMYYAIQLLGTDLPWQRSWRKFVGVIGAFGYRTRLLRRLPTPIPTPIELPDGNGTAALPVAPATQVAMAPVPPSGPQWYALETDEILGREHLLAEAGILCYPFSLLVPNKGETTAVVATRIADVESVLGLASVDAVNVQSDINGVVFRTYPADIGDFEIDDALDADAEFIHGVLQAVSCNLEAQNFSCDVISSSVHVSSDRVGIGFISAGQFDPYATAIKTVFGWSRADGREIRRLTNIGTDESYLIRDAARNVLAEVQGRYVRVLCDLLKVPDKWAASALARILYDAVTRINATTADDEADVTSWRKDMERHRSHYVTLRLKHLDDRHAKLVDRVNKCDASANEAGETIAKSVRERHNLLQEIKKIDETERVEETERLKREFATLTEAKPIIAVRAFTDRIEVDTRTVRIMNNGTNYEIGRFRITINDGGHLHFNNLSNTNRESTHMHPHIGGTGGACLGTLSEAVAKLIGKREYATAINLLFGFLGSYNYVGRMVPITQWKAVK